LLLRAETGRALLAECLGGFGWVSIVASGPVRRIGILRFEKKILKSKGLIWLSCLMGVNA